MGVPFDRWQHGDCGVYAAALIREAGGGLRLGILTQQRDPLWIHCFAHDDEWAYDSRGRVRLADVTDGRPPGTQVEALDQDMADYWGAVGDPPAGLLPEFAAALAHARENGVWP